MDYSGALIGVAVCYFLSLAYLDPVTKTITDIDAFYKLFLISLVPAFIGWSCSCWCAKSAPTGRRARDSR